MNGSDSDHPDVLSRLSAILNQPGAVLTGLGGEARVLRPAEEQSLSGTGGEKLSRNEEQALAELKRIDRDVRAHERAHLLNAGPRAMGGPKFEYTIGPDGKPYATGGHVLVDMTVSSDPAETRSDANAIERAALAVSNPSIQDRSVAHSAQMMRTHADLSADYPDDRRPRLNLYA